MSNQSEPWADLRQTLAAVDLTPLANPLLASARRSYANNRHGHWEKWQLIMRQIADLAPPSKPITAHDFADAVVRIGDAQEYLRNHGHAAQTQVKRLLLQLAPWRKGPFEFFGIPIDSEWQSNLKWERLNGKISELHGRRILDVGCGNGYYLWRMLGEGASIVLGIDPSQLFIAQFNILKHYCVDCPAFVLPLKSEQFPCDSVEKNSSDKLARNGMGFDTVFSMGVLSHRRNPHAHLRELQKFARRGGELVIETLVVDGGQDDVLVPTGRYAKMRNIYSLPSTLALEKWLRKSGATDIRLLDLGHTQVNEQRATEWMQFESLSDFLDQADADKTIEGYPAPQRAIFVCQTPH